MPYVGTCQGRLIDPLSDDLEKSPPSVLFEECTQSIVKKNRYNGHTNAPYTVGQHTLILLAIVEHFGPEIYGAWYNDLYDTVLLHDMHEAFTGDMPRPLKVVLPEFTAFEKKIAEKVHKALWRRPEAPSSNSLKLLNLIDTDICATWEMPTFGVGFFRDQKVTRETLRTGVQLLLRVLSYRDLIHPSAMHEKSSDASVDKLLERFDEIRGLDWREVSDRLHICYHEM